MSQARCRLTGKYSDHNRPRGNRNFGDISWAKIQPIVDELTAIGREVGKTPTAVALNWVMCKGAIPIPTCKNATQVEDCAQSLGWRLSDEQEERLDKVGRVNDWDLNLLKHFQNWCAIRSSSRRPNSLWPGAGDRAVGSFEEDFLCGVELEGAICYAVMDCVFSVDWVFLCESKFVGKYVFSVPHFCDGCHAWSKRVVCFRCVVYYFAPVLEIKGCLMSELLTVFGISFPYWRCSIGCVRSAANCDI
ncbi:putative Uncharacterized oxidoreductase, chloroplastic [Glarea lozoyensis 74030]|uniref:Putative Uncharacterized oxidoreductase, chloroplastic n=1 Tax=Glarea lozoyensis (strain ATCC 74030 / MF5533) TaxID=1104152 RepID=H0EGM4_GLAL7|nr:putative Uncharacterized oxidoreductase, chloroplastic [Glarea lozoyensis 74030]